jgi:hypothetical protein
MIKCFATAISTGVLLFIAPILFGASSSPVVIPGASIVLIASWLYIEGAIPSVHAEQTRPASPSNESTIRNIASRFRIWVLLLAIATTTAIVVYIHIICGSLQIFHQAVTVTGHDQSNHDSDGFSQNKADGPSEAKLESPFKNTLGMVRWNSKHSERVPFIRKYEPFFHTLHLSLPDYLNDTNLPVGYHNLTDDSWNDRLTPYVQVAKTMQLVLDNEPEINGLLFFHFDAWIDPLDFAYENFNNMWIPDRSDPRDFPLLCMEDRSKFDWQWTKDNFMCQNSSLQAAKSLSNFELDYIVNDKEWCSGWSDIYYIPRRFFHDWIFLSTVFGSFDTFHEIAVPTMMHIIDQSRREHPTRSVWSRIGNCWGNCCIEVEDLHDLMSYRLGHKLNYANPNETLVNAHFDRLDRQAALLGTRMEKPIWKADTVKENAVNGVEKKVFNRDITLAFVL